MLVEHSVFHEPISVLINVYSLYNILLYIRFFHSLVLYVVVTILTMFALGLPLYDTWRHFVNLP